MQLVAVAASRADCKLDTMSCPVMLPCTFASMPIQQKHGDRGSGLHAGFQGRPTGSGIEAVSLLHGLLGLCSSWFNHEPIPAYTAQSMKSML